MALTKGVTRKVEIPHEPDQWVQLRMLTYRQLAEARRVKLDDLFTVMRGLKDIALPQQDGQAVADPLAGYDVGVLLRYGIVAWSYGETVTPDELDDRTAQWAAREILAMAVPDEAAVGKASSPSTAISADPVPLRRSG